jgi:hypothetical protein
LNQASYPDFIYTIDRKAYLQDCALIVPREPRKLIKNLSFSARGEGMDLEARSDDKIGYLQSQHLKKGEIGFGREIPIARLRGTEESVSWSAVTSAPSCSEL